MKIETFLSDSNLIFASVIGLIIIILIPIVFLRKGNIKNEEIAIGANKKKSKDPEKRKEEIKMVRAKAKSMLQDYTESCRKSQINTQNSVCLEDVNVLNIDDIVDYIIDRRVSALCIRKLFN